MQPPPRPPAGRHRWGGEKPALLVLAGVLSLALVVGLIALAVSGDETPPPDTTAAESESPADASMKSGDRSASPSKSPSKSGKPDKYTPGDNPHGAAEVCGGGFKSIDKLTVKADGTTLGTVELLHDAGSGSNCVVTLKAVDIGDKTPMGAVLQVQGEKAVTDAGEFDYYAGPVTRKAADTCVKWNGSIDGVTVNGGDWDHCG